MVLLHYMVFLVSLTGVPTAVLDSDELTEFVEAIDEDFFIIASFFSCLRAKKSLYFSKVILFCLSLYSCTNWYWVLEILSQMVKKGWEKLLRNPQF